MMTDNNAGFSGSIDAAIEAAEAAARTEAQKEEAERVAYNARQEAERKARIESRYPLRLAIVKAAREQGALADATKDDTKVIIDGIDVSLWLAFVYEDTRVNRFRSVPNGKTRITVGNYGERKSYPQRKDGTHNYSDIAAELLRLVGYKKAAQKADAMRAANGSLACELDKEFNLPEYHGLVSPSAHSEGKVVIDFAKIGKKISTQHEAREILRALRKLGVKLSYNDK